MWKRVSKVLTAIVWVLAALLAFGDKLAKAIGWLTVPDDIRDYVVPLWQRWGAAVLTWETAHLALFAWATVTLLWVNFGEAVAEWIKRRRSAPFRISFSDQGGPLDVPRSPYRMTGLLGRASEDGAGVKLDGAVLREVRVFGAKNVMSETARNVRAEITGIAHDGYLTHKTAIPLPNVALNARSHIQPGDEQFFTFVEFLAPYRGGVPFMFGLPPQAVPEEELDYLRRLTTENWVAGYPYGLPTLGVPSIDGGYQIGLPLRDHELWLDVAIYADDKLPTFARFVLKRNHDLNVRLAAQGFSLPTAKEFARPSRGGIAQRILRKIRRG